MKKLILTAAACAAIVANALTVTDVTARQRWPWNNLVDVDFTINGVSGEAYYIDISATAAGGEKKLCATSFTTEPIAATWRNRIVWDLGTDYPNFKADDLSVTVTATPFSDSTPLYLVVDISGGTAAAKWPVRYTTTAPVHTAGVADPCKTTELWLKRVKAKGETFTAGGGTGSGTWQYYAQHKCTLTNDFYLGIFELTQAQCRNLTGDYMSKFTNEAYRATRPADSIDPRNIRQPYFNSSSPGEAITSGFMKTLRDRTGGLKFDLPTEWQLTYAGQAGTGNNRYNAQLTAVRYNGNSKPADGDANWTTGNQGDWPADYGTSYVDQYSPNPWGFYGMLGNVGEACLNRRLSGITYNNGVFEYYTDPMGDSGTQSERPQVGGSWSKDGVAAQVACRWNLNPANTVSEWECGARICLMIGK